LLGVTQKPFRRRLRVIFHCCVSSGDKEEIVKMSRDSEGPGHATCSKFLRGEKLNKKKRGGRTTAANHFLRLIISSDADVTLHNKRKGVVENRGSKTLPDAAR